MDYWGGGGEGAKGMLVAPLSNYWVGLPPPPLFYIEIEGKCGWIIGGEGGGRGQRVCWWPPSQIIGWAFAPPLFYIEIEVGWLVVLGLTAL